MTEFRGWKGKGGKEEKMDKGTCRETSIGSINSTTTRLNTFVAAKNLLLAKTLTDLNESQNITGRT
jgi:hypothetical protein